MEERRNRIHDDLRGLISGDLIFDPVGRSAYAFDASLYEIDPLGVVVPRTRDDVATVVRYASEHSIPVHARGAGTGLAGECLGPGLVVDFSRYLRRIVSLAPDHAVVQPGVVLDVLNAQLAPRGLRIGPDPSGSETCTIGGMIASDSAGARSLRHGTTADHVLGLEVVLANGDVTRLATEPWPSPESEPSDRKGQIARRVALHLDWHADLIARKAPRSARNRAGYALGQTATPDGLNLARLIVGSEGTLALATEATLRLVPIPTSHGVVVLPFARLIDAAEAVADALRDHPSACELIDWRRLILAKDADPDLRHWISDAAEAALAVEFEGNDAAEVWRNCWTLADRVRRQGKLVAEPLVSSRRSDCERWLDLRRLITPLVMRAPGRSRPIPLIEDIAVPPEALADFTTRLQGILRGYGLTWTFHAHAGHGQLHVRPFLDLSDPSDLAKLEPLASQVYEEVWNLGGTISGEHGCGLLRSQFLRRQYGELADVFREIKYAFDPQGLLNPGKIVCDDPHQMTRFLRRVVPTSEMEATSNRNHTIETVETGERPPPIAGLTVLPGPSLRWEEGRGRLDHVAACNGCGDCRTVDPSMRMCPTFRGLRSELASPRSQVNLLRRIASGELDPRFWGSEQMRSQADLCVHCQLCRSECPAGIDVSALMLEAKAAYVEDHGMTPADWATSRIDVWSRWASRMPALSNAMLGNRRARWVIERLFGLSRHRLVPKAAQGSFLKKAERLGLTRPHPQHPGPRVAYFVDLFANHFDPVVAEATVGVLRHAGVNVFVPKGQRGCGMPSLVTGDLDRARELLLTNLRILGNAVRDGYTIVCTEPTALLVLKQLALKLTDDLDAGLVAENSMDIGQYLAGLHRRGSLPRPTVPLPAKAGYHQPCHLRALEIGTPGLDLMKLIPGLEVEFIDRGCSGIAGVFGLTRRNFRTSLRAGRGLRNRLKEPDIEIGATECGTCRLQMEQGLTKRTHHPIKLLAMGYGLLPTLRPQFKDAKARHVIA